VTGPATIVRAASLLKAVDRNVAKSPDDRFVPNDRFIKDKDDARRAA
jgi:hypothetical protein